MNRQLIPSLIALTLAGVLGAFPAVAQNENETTGFSSTHVFDGGYFGENIDTLNGNLNLTIPIGPRYQVNQNLSYQLKLVYNSKIWEFLDTTRTAARTKIWGESPLGVGFNLSLGRVYEDQSYLMLNGVATLQYRWYFVTPDGQKHDVGAHMAPGAGLPAFTNDTTYYQLWKDGGTLSLIDGTRIRYTLKHHVTIAEGGPCVYDDGSSYCQWQEKNAAFGGWYVTSIEDTSSGTIGANPLCPSLYPNCVQVTYETDLGYGQCVKTITDSVGRTITFTNNLLQSGDKRSARTEKIEMPKFGDSSDLVPSAIIAYEFEHTYPMVYVPEPRYDYESGTVVQDTKRPVVRLDGISLPGGIHMSFVYDLGGLYDNQSELLIRTVPMNETGDSNNLARVRYYYNSYTYYKDFYYQSSNGGPETYYAGGVRIGATTSGLSRQIFKKELYLTNPFEEDTSQLTATWQYSRSESYLVTNPSKASVRVTAGGLDNETVYYYRSSLNPDNSDEGQLPNDGLAPEWYDGLNYRIEYWEGREGTGRLLRTEETTYTPDIWPWTYTKSNVRPVQTITTFNDDGGKQVIRTNSDWDNRGHWRTVSESGYGMTAPRITRTAYVERYGRTDIYDYVEVTDANSVLSRSDYQYDTAGRLWFSINRKTVPSVPESAVNPMAMPGDVVTKLTYDPVTGNVTHKDLADGGACADPAGGSCTATYGADYTYGRGGYLSTKAFTGLSPTWYAINWERDGNTGLIRNSCDPSGVCTEYSYDELGRVTFIKPLSSEGSEEYPTAIYYPGGNLHEVYVRQWVNANKTNLSLACASGDDCLEAQYFYDDLGRLVETRKRDSLGTMVYQRTQYDALSNVTWRTEWVKLDAEGFPVDPSGSRYAPDTHAHLNLMPGLAQEPNYPSTTYDYTDPIGNGQDPFGRPWKTTTADKQETQTSYRGQDTAVTVKNINGPNDLPYDASTVYSVDGLGRLVEVSYPSGRYQGSWQSLPRTAAKAEYEYDHNNNLTRVNLIAPDFANQVRNFSYDALNRLIREDNPENGTTLYTAYDALGNLKSKQDSAGNVLIMGYDAAGRLLTTRGNLYLLAENTYDVPIASCTSSVMTKGKLTQVQSFPDGGGTTPQVIQKYCYDGLNGRLSSEFTSFADWAPAAGLRTAYTYNAFGLRSTVKYPDEGAEDRSPLDLTASYRNGFQVLLRDTSTDGAVHVSNIEYNPAGGIRRIDLPGSADVILPDARNRPAGITVNGILQGGSPGVLYDSGTYQYDGAGNIKQIGPSAYRYDEANRLIEALEWDNTHTILYTLNWSYDAFGNMLQSTQQASSGSSSTRLFSVDPATNHIQSMTEGSLTRLLNYDSRGNIIHADWDHSYAYDIRNRATAITKYLWSTGGSMVGQFAYDAAGHRAIKTIDGTTIHYVRDQSGQVLSEYRKSTAGPDGPAWDRDYLYATGRLVGEAENDNPHTPTKLSISRWSPNWIKLTWQASSDPDIQNYRVYECKWQNDNCTFTLAGTPTGALFSENLKSAIDRYSYKVIAVDLAGHESSPSETISIVFSDMEWPTGPGTLSLVPDDSKIAVSWAPATDNVQVLGYEVWRDWWEDGQPRTVRLSPPELLRATALTDGGMANGISYTYGVRAYDTGGNSGLWVTGSATPQDTAPPGPPTDLVVQPECADNLRTIYLSWAPNAPGDGVIQYRIFRDGAFLKTPDPPTATTVSDTLEATVVQASYKIVARDAALRDSFPSEERTVQLRLMDGTLIAPSPTTTAGDERVTVRWNKSTCSAPTCKAYAVYRRLNVEQSCLDYVRVGTVAMDASRALYTFEDITVTNAVAYEYALTLVDTTGREGAFSSSALAVPLETVKDVYRCRPDNIPVDCDAQITKCPDGTHTCQKWSYRWKPVSIPAYQPFTASPLDSPQGYLKGYRVYRYYYFSDSDNYLQWYRDNNLGQDTPMDYGLAWGRDSEFSVQYAEGDKCHIVTAVYKVFVNGTWKTMESGWSKNLDLSASPVLRCPTMQHDVPWCSLKKCETETGQPPPPESVTAEPGPHANEIRVSWTPPLVNTEPYLDIAGYYVYVKDPLYDLPVPTNLSTRRGGTPVAALFRSDHPYMRVDPFSTSIILTGLKSCRSYSFYVAAISGSGRLSEPSTTTVAVTAPVATPIPVPHGLRPRLWTSNDTNFADTDLPNASTEVARLVWDIGFPGCETGTELQTSMNLLDWQPVDTSTLPVDYFPGSFSLYTREWTLSPPAGVPVFYRRVTNRDGISVESPPVAIEVLPHASPPLSPPSHFDAIRRNSIQLRWCPNPTAEQVTGYRIFRSTVPGGPYERVRFTGENTTADGDIVSTVYSFNDLGSNEIPSVPLTPISVRYYYVVAAVRNGVVSALSPENGAGNLYFYDSLFDPDSFLIPTDWLIFSPPHTDELLKYCDDDYVENRPWSSPTSGVVQEGVACFDEPGIMKSSRPWEGETAPYKMIGGFGGVSYHMTYYHLDHLGSPRILTDSAGVRVQGQHFLPFGEEMPVEAGVNARKFTGHERDAETGLDYMMARYYRGQFGRFASPDPSDESVDLEQPQSWNRYSYVLNNPMNLVDPDGRMAIVDDVAIAGGIAVIVAVSAYLNSPSAGDPTRTNAQVLAGSIVAATDQFTTHFISNKSAQKGAQSSLEVALEHFGKVASSPPGDPGRGPWRRSIEAAIKNIERMIKRMGPAARQKWLEVLKELRERLQALKDSGAFQNPALSPPPKEKPTVNPNGGTTPAPDGTAGAGPLPSPGGAGVTITCPGNEWCAK